MKSIGSHSSWNLNHQLLGVGRASCRTSLLRTSHPSRLQLSWTNLQRLCSRSPLGTFDSHVLFVLPCQSTDTLAPSRSLPWFSKSFLAALLYSKSPHIFTLAGVTRLSNFLFPRLYVSHCISKPCRAKALFLLFILGFPRPATSELLNTINEDVLSSKCQILF